MIDWTLAHRIAEGISGLQPAPDGRPFESLAGPAAESERLVRAYTGLVPAAPVPAAEAVGRTAWIESNLGSLRSVMDPAADRLGRGMGVLQGPARAAGGAVLALEVGAISGVLSQRVLGQYEFPILEPEAPARLLFVAPNLAHVAASLPAEADELLAWVALHETTHAFQFGGVPWLRRHLATMARELLDALDIDPRKLVSGFDVTDLRSLADAYREGRLTGLVIGPERQAVLDRLQAFMAVLEGYAEHVMDAAGPELLPNLPRLREALDRRRRDRTGLLRIFEKLIGLDMKLRQYEQGKAFCDAVVAKGGMPALNRVWEAPERMPTPAELEDPAAWVKRTDAVPPRLTAGA